jgi:ATP-dependent exoDNAse (exonuclease V) beta subunit
VGNLVHEVLQYWTLSETPDQDAVRLRSLEPWLQQRLQSVLPSAFVSEALQRVTHCLQQALTHDRVRWALQTDHSEAKSEWALSEVVPWSDQIQVLQTVVDRTLVDDSGRRWIIDYKTNQPPASLTDTERAAWIESLTQTYAPQLARYGELIARLESRPQTQVLYLCALNQWVEVNAELDLDVSGHGEMD